MNLINQSIAHLKMPSRIAKLPISDTGFPVPWFVAWIDGKPDFRIVDTPKVARAHNGGLCWLCGEPLGRFKCFVIGPMCAVNRVTAEPPCHRDCAEYAQRACPFLIRPRAKRNEVGMPEHYMKPAGDMIPRNPGVTLLWICHDYSLMRVSNGVLFRVGAPVETVFFAEGRPATRDEVMHSMETGYPLLRAAAEEDGRDAVDELEIQYRRAMELVPAN
jgi:hypothetical protein